MIEIELKAAVLLARLKVALDHMEELLPDGIAWAQGIEDEVLATGDRLPESWLLVAKHLGVKDPEKIRIKIYDPELPVAPETGMANSGLEFLIAPSLEDGLKPLGQTSGYGIGIAARALRAFYGATYRQILCHEMVHVGQFERSGSLAEFVRLVARNALQYGHGGSPIELEAHKLGKAAALAWCEITGEVERQTKISMERVPAWRKRLEDRFAKRDAKRI